jgi:hypothetical protein
MLTVTAIFETNNCRTWISGETHNVSAHLIKAKESSPESYKLIRMDKGNTTKPKAKFSMGLY